MFSNSCIILTGNRGCCIYRQADNHQAIVVFPETWGEEGQARVKGQRMSWGAACDRTRLEYEAGEEGRDVMPSCVVINLERFLGMR